MEGFLPFYCEKKYILSFCDRNQKIIKIGWQPKKKSNTYWLKMLGDKKKKLDILPVWVAENKKIKIFRDLKAY